MMLRWMILLFALTLNAAGAHAKSLHWRSVDVTAQLDREGALHVAETQVYVFDGDWNGGERIFNIRPGQALRLEGVERIEDGRAVALQRGNLAAMDGYELSDSSLRWRSRHPFDPPFDHKELTYRIRYTLTGILRGRDGRYDLAHDFAFPDRSGVIEHYALSLTVAPEWSGIESPLAVTREQLTPGEGVIVRRALMYQGAGTPAAAVALPSPVAGYALALLLAGGWIFLFLRFLRGERAVGRLATLTPPDAIDEAWLQAHVFSLPPEVVGAAWHGTTGAPEVAAILATLAHEKKIESSVQKRFLRKPKLSMRLLVPRDHFAGYQQKIIQRLFFGGGTTTDTDAIRRRYRGSGLDLAALIRGPVEQQLQRFPRWQVKNPVANWKRNWLLLGAALALLIASPWLGGGSDSTLVTGEIFYGLISLALASIAARKSCRAVAGLAWRFGLVILLALPLLVETLLAFASTTHVRHVPVQVAAVLWNLALFNLLLDALRSDEAPERIVTRKNLAAARAFLAAQLRSRTPRLRDEWFPWLIAFGLGAGVDAWFRRYAGVSAAGTGTAADEASTSYSSGSGSGSSWTGGGGSFGGAGATGTWALAAGAVASGVSSSSSSGGGGSSSSSDSGGGSSSGGGGGGGW